MNDRKEILQRIDVLHTRLKNALDHIARNGERISKLERDVLAGIERHRETALTIQTDEEIEAWCDWMNYAERFADNAERYARNVYDYVGSARPLAKSA